MITALLAAHVTTASLTLVATGRLGARALTDPSKISRQMLVAPWLGFGSTSLLGVGLIITTGAGFGRACAMLSGLVLAIAGVEVAALVARRKVEVLHSAQVPEPAVVDRF